MKYLQVLHWLSVGPSGSAPLSAEFCPPGQLFHSGKASRFEHSIVEVELVKPNVMNVKRPLYSIDFKMVDKSARTQS